MNKLSSRERKRMYFVAILVLLVPITWLGMPADEREGSGGVLARLRSEHDLGESNLGNVDPTSATMNLLLLGLRGVAVNILRMDLDYYKDHKEWAKMRATTESVIKLQPHYIEVWRFLSWNLSYNVSAEWDAVPDRYYWVKEGGKFAQRGTTHNRDIPELYWDCGKTWGHKVGRSDEWRYFRKYFVSDPDKERFNGQPDPEINRDGKDNYLVARDWFVQANVKEQSRVQHIMMRALFRAYPTRAWLDMADALQRDVKYETDEKVIAANFAKASAIFKDAYQEWTEVYGREVFDTSDAPIMLEANEDDVKRLALDGGVTETTVRNRLAFYQNTTNYRYWRERARSEAEPTTAEAHLLLYEGERAFKRGDLEKARQQLERGMALYAGVLEKFTELSAEELALEEGMWAVLIWRKTLELLNQPVPENFLLKKVWDAHQAMLPELQDRFNSMGY